MKKLFTILLAVMMMIAAGCSMEAPGGEKSASKEEGKDSLKVGFSISTLNNPFFVTLKEGAEAKANELGIELVTVDAQNDAAKQTSDVEDLIQQGADLILINPTDSAAVGAAVAAANDANVPVITVDRSAESGEVVTHIASDNVEGGKMAGEYVLELVGEGANVVELEGIPGSSAARDRGEGFHKAVDSKLNVVAKQTANFDRAQGLSVMENILQSNGDIKAVFAHNDEMALGALEALKAAGKNDVLVVGFDATDDAVNAVNNGEMAGTVAQKPDLIGQMAMDAAKKVLDGETVENFIPVNLELVKK